MQILKYWFKSSFSFMIFVFMPILKILSIVVPLPISVAYFTTAENKIMDYFQRRKGPISRSNPLSDGLKLFKNCYRFKMMHYLSFQDPVTTTMEGIFSYIQLSYFQLITNQKTNRLFLLILFLFYYLICSDTNLIHCADAPHN